MEYIEKAILKTLLYSDIFDFPLILDELWEFLVTDRRVSKKMFERTLTKLSTKNSVVCNDGYYCLSGREEIIEKRKENLSEVEKKLRIAKKAAYYLSHIPTIKFIGISGGLAMYDAGPEDDIDFFIIVQKKTLFLTRIWVLGFLEVLKLRRTRLDKSPANKICVNFFIDETKLLFSKEKRDIYIAHEIVQIKPLFEKGDIYRKFLKTNSWIKQFFPNAAMQSKGFFLENKQFFPNFIKVINFLFSFSFLSAFSKWIQIRSIRQHQTTETVSENILAFHSNDYRLQTLKELNLKMRQFGLLTKI